MRLLWLSVFVWLGAVQTVHIYKAQHRPAAELTALAESAMGGDGFVTLDARTATLILNGSKASIDSAIRLLERVDRPLRQVLLTQETREVVDAEAFFARVAWKAAIGPVRLGTLPGSSSGIIAALGGSARSESTVSRSSLRLTEGGTGVIATGRALPVFFEPYWGTTTYANVETGFEAAARIVGVADKPTVLLELRPFAGRVAENGELSYIATASSIAVAPGETVVLGETLRASESAQTDFTGVTTETKRVQTVLLIQVDLPN